ncbi:FRG domain-containing protein [Hypericibacter terrae]|uniref:FRG domain-containing protein n=1 Tax=Hypericibacter terrae TaxID=2602015 RepID=UPI0017857C7B|nr:FRG domain-containing protein [Hypericibacter terrae]
MSKKITSYKPSDLPSFMSIVQKLQRKAGHPLWFRGTGAASHRLIPSLYRHPSIQTLADLQLLERQLMTRFRQRSLPYHTRNLGDDWEALFFMQHYGVPTRLLDWTENPFVGLHFALMSAPRLPTSRNKTLYKEPAIVWVLDPVAWNRSALRHVSYKGGPLTAGDDDLKGYTPGSSLGTMGKYPIALFGAHNSARIVAQQGVFTIFGASKEPMESLLHSEEIPPECLSCIVVSETRIQPMRKSILNQGITETVVFPDLEGLARETKRHFGFEV